jgi:hypothetical protein
MEIIAQTKGGFLIQASTSEVQELFSAVSGVRPKYDQIEVGHKIPAMDYASTVRVIQTVKDDHYFKELLAKGKSVARSLAAFEEAIESATKIGKP